MARLTCRRSLRMSGVDRKWLADRQNDAIDPNRTLRAPRRELWYPPSNAMGRFNEAADPQMALAARAEGPRAPRQRKMAWHPHLLGAARPRRRGDRMIAPGKLARSSRWKTGPSKGYRPPGSECCVAPGEVPRSVQSD